MTVKELSKQPWDFGALYSYASPNLDGRGRLFVFNGERDFVEREFGGLEGAIRFEEEHCPGDFEFGAVVKTPTGFVSTYDVEEEEKKCFNDGNCFFVKGHPYQSLVTLHRIEQAMPKNDKYELIPLRKYFGTNDTIVTELLWHPSCQNLDYTSYPVLYKLLPGVDDRYWEGHEEVRKFDELLKKARISEEGKIELKQFIANHIAGGGGSFQEYAQRFIWDERREDMLPQEIRDVKVEEFLPFAEEALDALYRDLEAVGRKLRISHHIDARLANTFFRGIRDGKLQFTLIDQYHCGWAEKSHHDRKFGNLPTLRL